MPARYGAGLELAMCEPPFRLAALVYLMTQYVGYLAGFLTVLSFLPQVLRTWRTKQTKDLSVRTFVLLIIASVLWSTYGVLSSDWPVIATNGGMLILNSAILTAKLRYK